MRELATIVIPYWGAGWTSADYALLRHNITALDGFSLVFLCSEHADSTPLTAHFPNATIYRFGADFFLDRKSITRLLLSAELYEYFGWREYLLFLDPSCYIVKNELHYWCKQGHDYISDPTGRLSLRNVDRFHKLTRRGGSAINRFLNAGAPPVSDYLYWQKKASGIWPSLRSPTTIVSSYFSVTLSPTTSSLETAELPFAVTGIDLLSETHSKWIEARSS